MKDWRRSPEPPGMMGLKEPAYQVQGNWGQPEALVSSSDVDPASPLPHTTPGIFRTDASSSSHFGHQSLYSMALRVILRNISSVQDLGVLPYRHARPILEECRIEQLILLEESSPHLLTHTEEIWKRNCLRDFIHIRRKYDTPGLKEPKSWRKLYLRTKGETEQAKVDAARRIKDKYEQYRAEKEAKKLVVSDRPLHKAKAVRKFGAAPTGGMSKGQSLMSKARSGSVAQAKLSGRPQGGVYRTQGRSRAVGMEIAPEAAGVGRMVRPMVAPRRVLGGASEGLAQMGAFSRPTSETVTDDSRSRAAPSSSSSRRAADNSHGGSNGEPSGLPLLKPREVAATPSLTSSSLSARSTAGSSSPTAASSNHKPPSSPPPDIARTERRKVDFFGSGAKLSPSTDGSTTISSPVATSRAEVRGVKRTHNSNAPSSSSRSNGTSSNIASTSSRLATSASASSPTSTSFFPSKPGNSGGVRVVQAKRARTQPSNPDPSPVAPSPSVVKAATSAPNATAPRSRPSPPVKQLSNGSLARVQDSRTARASPAALSSIFMPSSSPSRGRR